MKKSQQVARALKELIRERGYSQREFAAVLDRSEQEVSKWLSGRHNFTLKTIEELEFTMNVRLMHISLKTNCLPCNSRIITRPGASHLT